MFSQWEDEGLSSLLMASEEVTLGPGTEGPPSGSVESLAAGAAFGDCESPQSCQPVFAALGCPQPVHTLSQHPGDDPILLPEKPNQAQGWHGRGMIGPEGSERGLRGQGLGPPCPPGKGLGGSSGMKKSVERRPPTPYGYPASFLSSDPTSSLGGA